MTTLGVLDPLQGWDPGSIQGLMGGFQDAGGGLPRPVIGIRGDM